MTTVENDVPKEDMEQAHVIWDYMLMGHTLKKSDIILGLGCSDRRVAQHCARLWLDGWAPMILFSGKHGHVTKDKWLQRECEVFKDIAVAMGVPEENILLEGNATNTMENITESYKVLKDEGVSPKSVILVHRPFMERRSFATFMKLWPDKGPDLSVCVASPPITLEEYPCDDVGSLAKAISLMIGCLQRIMGIYTTIIPQDVPDTVREAFNKLASKQQYQSYLKPE